MATKICAFRWYVANLKVCSDKGLLNSPIFHFAPYEFFIKLYPRGNRAGNYISIYLASPQHAGATIPITFSISFLHPKDPTKARGLSVLDHTFCCPDKGDWGWTQMMPLEAAAEFISDGSMTVQLLMSIDKIVDTRLLDAVVEDFIWINTKQDLKPKQFSLLSRLMYESRDATADVIIVVSQRDFCCHRAVLAAGSEYFKRMFFHLSSPSTNFSESKNLKVKLCDIDPDIFDILLRYLYFFEPKEIWNQMDKLLSLLAAAELLQIDQLLDSIIITNHIAPIILDASFLVLSRPKWQSQALTHILHNHKSIPKEAYESVSFECLTMIIEAFMLELFGNSKTDTVGRLKRLAQNVAHWFYVDYAARKCYIDKLLANPKTMTFFHATDPYAAESEQLHEIMAQLFPQYSIKSAKALVQ